MEYDIQPYPLYGLWHNWWYEQRFLLTKVALITFILVVGVVLLILFIRKNRQPIIPAWSQALTDINHLDPTVNTKNYYDALAAIIRNYLLLRYDVATQGLTDEELLGHFRVRTDCPESLCANLQAFIAYARVPRFSSQTDSFEYSIIQNLGIAVIKSTIPS